MTVGICLACTGSAHAIELKDCEQADSAVVALRVCTALIDAADTSKDDRARGLTRRGLAWLTEEESAAAVADFTRALEIDPASAAALKGRANAHIAQGEHQRAIEDWTVLIGKASGSTEMESHYLERAASFLAAGNPDAALADYSKILEINAKSIKAHIGRGNVYAGLNDRDKALREYASAQDIDSADPAPYIARAQAAERWGDTKLAIENYSFVVKNNTRSAGPSRQALRRLGVDTPP